MGSELHVHDSKQVQKRSMRYFYYKLDRIDCQKYTALLKIHTYLMQFMVGTGTEFKTDKLKEINHFRQQDWVQIICTSANYKFNDYSFIENIEYCNTIENTNAIMEAAKAAGKTANHSTNHKKTQSKTTKRKYGKGKKKYSHYGIKNHLTTDCCK